MAIMVVVMSMFLSMAVGWSGNGIVPVNKVIYVEPMCNNVVGWHNAHC